MSRWVTDRSFTSKKATANELRVKQLLESKWGYEVEVSKNKYEVYDLYGTRGDEGALWEIKQRRQAWEELIIEESKIKKCLDIANKSDKFVSAYLVCSIDDTHYIYDMRKIKKNGRLDTLKCNATTAQGFRDRGKKVDKSVYYFKMDSHDFVLEP